MKATNIPIRLTEESRNRIKTIADSEGITVSAWIRKRIEGDAIVSRLDVLEAKQATLESILSQLVARIA